MYKEVVIKIPSNKEKVFKTSQEKEYKCKTKVYTNDEEESIYLEIYVKNKFLFFTRWKNLCSFSLEDDAECYLYKDDPELEEIIFVTKEYISKLYPEINFILNILED